LIDTLAILPNNAGAGIKTTVKKPPKRRLLAFKTIWSARALIVLLWSDDFSFNVSLDGWTFYEAIHIEPASGRVETPELILLPALDAVPAPPPRCKFALYARDRMARRSAALRAIPRTTIGTVSAPSLVTTNLSTSIRRWRVTSAATADAAAEERSAGWICQRGNAMGWAA
jgi:hypothetical protein